MQQVLLRRKGRRSSGGPGGGEKRAAALAQAGFRVAVEDADTAVLRSDAGPPVPVKWP